MYVRVKYKIDVYDEGRDKPKTRTQHEAVEFQVVAIRYFERRTYIKGEPNCTPQCAASHHWLVKTGWDLREREDIVEPMFVADPHGEADLIGLSEYRELSIGEEVEVKYGTAKDGIEVLEILDEVAKS